MNIQGALPKHGVLAAYSPIRGQPAGQAPEATYASELAEHQRAFQQLQDAIAHGDPSAELEGVFQSNAYCGCNLSFDIIYMMCMLLSIFMMDHHIELN